jgi:hypothetical protein
VVAALFISGHQRGVSLFDGSERPRHDPARPVLLGRDTPTLSRRRSTWI